MPYENLPVALGKHCLSRAITLVVAESCTGGLLSAAITSVPGSSAWFDRAYITYNNAAKQTCLAVPEILLRADGAVSLTTAKAMAQGALIHSQATIAMAITGIAGPDGGTPDKPIGTVCFAWGDKQTIQTTREHFSGNRAEIREASVNFALARLLDV